MGRNNFVSLEAHPDDRHLRTTVLVQRYQVGKMSARENLAHGITNRNHALFLVERESKGLCRGTKTSMSQRRLVGVGVTAAQPLSAYKEGRHEEDVDADQAKTHGDDRCNCSRTRDSCAALCRLRRIFRAGCREPRVVDHDDDHSGRSVVEHE